MKRKKLYILFFVLIIVLSGGFFINKKYYKNIPSEIVLSPSASISPTPTPSSTPTATSEPEPSPSKIPNSYLIQNFPFQPQAPFANWDQLHDEACEEAAVILVKWWDDDKSNISAQIMDDEILKMVDWEEKNWGSHHDLTVKETAQMAKSFYGLNLTAKYDIDIDDIKKEIAQDHPVIFPAAGRLMGNPYFRQPGPIYHMSVIIGYEGNNFIVQDVGTRRGDHYKYSQQILYNAIHDWNGSSDNINEGQKAILVLTSR